MKGNILLILIALSFNGVARPKTTEVLAKLHVAKAYFQQKWPDVFQRFYFSNSTSYTLKKYNLQTRIYSIFQAKYEFSKRNLRIKT